MNLVTTHDKMQLIQENQRYYFRTALCSAQHMIFAETVRPIEKAESARDRMEFPEWNRRWLCAPYTEDVVNVGSGLPLIATQFCPYLVKTTNLTGGELGVVIGAVVVQNTSIHYR